MPFDFLRLPFYFHRTPLEITIIGGSPSHEQRVVLRWASPTPVASHPTTVITTQVEVEEGIFVDSMNQKVIGSEGTAPIQDIGVAPSVVEEVSLCLSRRCHRFPRPSLSFLYSLRPTPNTGPSSLPRGPDPSPTPGVRASADEHRGRGLPDTRKQAERNHVAGQPST